MLGTEDLEYEVVGTKGIPIKGTPGFHSGAVHPTLVDNPTKFVGLVDDPSIPLPRIDNEGKSATIPTTYDVRKAKRDKVLAYKKALLLGGTTGLGGAFRG
jgi:hypothetical protein